MAERFEDEDNGRYMTGYVEAEGWSDLWKQYGYPAGKTSSSNLTVSMNPKP